MLELVKDIVLIIGACTAIGGYVMHEVSLTRKLKDLDIRVCKIQICDYLNDKHNNTDTIPARDILAYETYDHYIRELDQNGYVKKSWEDMIEKEKQDRQEKRAKVTQLKVQK